VIIATKIRGESHPQGDLFPKALNVFLLNILTTKHTKAHEVSHEKAQESQNIYFFKLMSFLRLFVAIFNP
jgi:hypothetical protein